jgi:hypothetical protein
MRVADVLSVFLLGFFCGSLALAIFVYPRFLPWLLLGGKP